LTWVSAPPAPSVGCWLGVSVEPRREPFHHDKSPIGRRWRRRGGDWIRDSRALLGNNLDDGFGAGQITAWWARHCQPVCKVFYFFILKKISRTCTNQTTRYICYCDYVIIILPMFLSFKLLFVGRQANEVAHLYARRASRVRRRCLRMSYNPSFLAEVLHKDCNPDT
jgi:hypothetical protein